MHDFIEFFSMGGYGLYVWSSYVLAFLLPAVLVWWTYRRQIQIEEQLAALANNSQSEDRVGTHATR